MQFIAIVSLLVAAVAANPLSIPGKSITLDGTASITFTISKWVLFFEQRDKTSS